MRINKLKINSYGNLKNKEINLDDGINIIYGKNESGKSTLISFIISAFYGISKNKNGKTITDYEKYEPWEGEEFSGKVEYQLDNNKKYEIYRDFRKKNPKLFDETMEEISNKYSIDKTKGSQFFVEQTKIDEELLLSTLAINQKEVELDEKNQNSLVQKLANLAQTGNDNTSYKKIIDNITKRQKEEVGTSKTKEKPINIVVSAIEKLEKEKEELEKYKDSRYEFEENENELKRQVEELEKKEKLLKELKEIESKQNIDREKIKVKEDIVNENKKQIREIDDKIKKLEKREIKNIDNNEDTGKTKLILSVTLAIAILLNIILRFFVKNTIVQYVMISVLAVYLVAYIFIMIREKKKSKKIKNIEKLNKENQEKDDFEIGNLKREKEIIEANNNKIEEEINEVKTNLEKDIQGEIIKNQTNYGNLFKGEYIENLLKNNRVGDTYQETLKSINDKKLEIHSLELDKENIEPKLERLAHIEEELISNKEKQEELLILNKSLEIAKETLDKVFDKMKTLVTPKFTENLSKNISDITDNKYNKVVFNENNGLMVELDTGDYISADRLSCGTLDQLYLSLRLSMADEITDEKVPIFLDEAFAFYDDVRLENVLKFLKETFKDRQIIIFTCTNREKEILEKNRSNYNFIEL